MSWTDQLGNLLKQYTTSTGSGAAAAAAPDVHAHFDQVAAAAPPSAIAEGLTAAFKSDRTPAFGQMLSTLFNNSSGDQKAGMVNHLIASVNPDILKQVLSGVGLAGVVGAGNTQLSSDQVQRLSPDTVQKLAVHAQNANPGIVETVSDFYSQHTTLIKTLGGTALTVALAKMASSQGKR